MLKCEDCGTPIKECRPNGDRLCSDCAAARLVRLRPSRYVRIPNLIRKYIIDGKEE